MTKADLRRARTELLALQVKIKILGDQITNLRELSEHITPTLSDMPHASNVSSKVADCAISITDYLNELLGLKLKFALLQESLTRTLFKLPSESEQAVMIAYYVNGYTWEEVAEETNYSVRQVYRIHGIALRHCSNL